MRMAAAPRSDNGALWVRMIMLPFDEIVTMVFAERNATMAALERVRRVYLKQINQDLVQSFLRVAECLRK